MADIAGEVLGYLQGKSPEEIRRVLSRLAREAQDDAEERQASIRDDLAGLDIEDLQEFCQRERMKNIHSDRYREAYAVLRAKWAEQDAARFVKPPPAPEEPPPPPPPRPDPRKKWYQLTGAEIDAKLGWESGRYTEAPPAPPPAPEGGE